MGTQKHGFRNRLRKQCGAGSWGRGAGRDQREKQNSEQGCYRQGRSRKPESRAERDRDYRVGGSRNREREREEEETQERKIQIGSQCLVIEENKVTERGKRETPGEQRQRGKSIW